jgi:hypothetical protein
MGGTALGMIVFLFLLRSLMTQMKLACAWGNNVKMRAAEAGTSDMMDVLGTLTPADFRFFVIWPRSGRQTRYFLYKDFLLPVLYWTLSSFRDRLAVT